MNSQKQGAAEFMDSYSYPDSVNSSPRSVGRASRGIVDSDYYVPHHHHQNQRWDQDQESLVGSGSVRFMCSYGGRILPRPHDNQLRYVGGDTRIVAVARNVSYSLLISKLSKLCGSAVTLKYQFPNEDLDALISVTTDEDLENMMEEYDRLQQLPGEINCSKSSSFSSSSRLRLFLFPAKPETANSSLGSLLESDKRELWFVDALNGAPILDRAGSEVSSVVSETTDYLFGLDPSEDSDRMLNRNPLQHTGKSRMSMQHGEGLNRRPDEEVYSVPENSSPHCSTSSALEPQQAGEIEMGKEAFDPLTSECIADHETVAALAPSGLQTQDQTLVLDSYITKIRPAEALQYSEQEQDASEGRSQIQLDFAGPTTREFSSSSMASMNQQGSVLNLNLPDNSRNPNDTATMQLKQDKSKYPYEATPTVMQQQQQIPTEYYMEPAHPYTMRREFSSSSLASMNQQGSVLNLNLPDNSRYPNDMATVQLKQDNSKYPDAATLTVMQQQQQIPAEHYMEPAYPYTYQYPQPYWQVHDPPSDQAIPFYMLSTGPVPSSVCPTGQPPGMPLQQIGPSAPITAPGVYSPEMLTSRSAVPPGAAMQMTQKVITKQGPSYPAKASASRAPLHRASSVVTDMRTMMRPSQRSVIRIPQDQYGYQQVVYETIPAPHVYHTQVAAVMMPQYQTVDPVTTELQPSFQDIPTSFQAIPRDPKIPKLSRVGQSL